MDQTIIILQVTDYEVSRSLFKLIFVEEARPHLIQVKVLPQAGLLSFPSGASWISLAGPAAVNLEKIHVSQLILDRQCKRSPGVKWPSSADAHLIDVGLWHEFNIGTWTDDQYRRTTRSREPVTYVVEYERRPLCSHRQRSARLTVSSRVTMIITSFFRSPVDPTGECMSRIFYRW